MLAVERVVRLFMSSERDRRCCWDGAEKKLTSFVFLYRCSACQAAFDKGMQFFPYIDASGNGTSSTYSSSSHYHEES